MKLIIRLLNIAFAIFWIAALAVAAYLFAALRRS